MPEYRTYGARDDRVTKDGDVGFIGFNNRLRPDQLQAGMLADAQNVRLDRNGEAQVRKGIELIEAPFAVGGDVLRLPTEAEIGTDVSRLPTTIESASLTSNVVSLVLNEPAVEPGYDFQVGDEVTVEGIQFVTTDPNGTFTLTGVTDAGGTSTLTYALTGADETYSTAIVLPETLPFTLNNITTQAVVGFNMVLDQGNVTEVYASTNYSDPADDASQYILIASNLKVVAKNLLTGATTDIVYPVGETVPVESDMIQAFNKVLIFRNGQTALEWDGDFSAITAGSFEIGKTYTIASVGDTDFTLIGAASNTVGVSFTATGLGSGTGTATSAFTKVPSGEYSQPKQLAPTRVDILDGRATMQFADIAAMNGLDVGEIFIIETDGSPAVFTPGEEYVVATRDDILFEITFYVQKPNKTNITGLIIQQRVSVGLGFTHMPAPPFATYHQRRLAMPFRFDVNDAPDSFTSRGILDEVILSEPLNSDTYDQVYAQYRFNAGTADFVVGLHSFAEDTLMVFNRNSIHTIFDTLSVANSKNRLLTNEVGCVARKSIIQVSNQVIFLSDNGVYGVQFLDEYNLRGTETPLSEPINETIQRINQDAWEDSVAAYFDNRYFIAVPLNYFNAEGTLVKPTRNNAILVFNFLNKQWESVDTTGNTDWDIENLVVAGDGAQRGVYAINRFGGIHRLDQRVDGEDRIVTFIGGEAQGIDIPASITTRQYTLGTLDRKRWKEFDIHVQSSEDNASDFDLSIETENPDTVESLGTLSTYNGGVLEIGEDVSIRGRIGNRRGYGLQFTINNTSGRPRIRAIETEGSTAMRSTQKAT